MIDAAAAFAALSSRTVGVVAALLALSFDADFAFVRAVLVLVAFGVFRLAAAERDGQRQQEKTTA